MLRIEPHNIGRTYETDDCSVIAFGNALGVSYDVAKDFIQLSEVNRGQVEISSVRKTKNEMIYEDNLRPLAYSISNDGLNFESALKHKTIKRLPTVDKFAEDFSKGTYLVFIDGHMLTVMDGMILDLIDSRWERVRFAFRVDRKKSQDHINKLINKMDYYADDHIVKYHKRMVRQLYNELCE